MNGMQKGILSISFLLIPFFPLAQLCTGSLGDPVVNITFGTVANGNPGITPPTGYTNTTSSCPNDGFYTIATSTSGCFNNEWHTVNTDHTGNGAFMLVNASYQPGDFYVGTVANLCPNTTYEFSSWIMNVLVSPSGIEPNITFSIETTSGTVLNQFTTGGIPVTPQPEWKQYGFFFTTTTGNPNIVLRMTNNAPGGIGNDLALDDITFRPCGPVLSSSIQGNNNKIEICVDEQVNFIFDAIVSAGFITPVYQWQVSIDSGNIWNDVQGANTLIFQRLPTAAGNFWYRLTVAENGNAGVAACRVSSNILTLNVNPKPVIDAGTDKNIISGKQTVLTATSNNSGNLFIWSPPDYLDNVTLLNPTASPDRDIYYTIHATSPSGCTNEDQVLVKVVTGIFVPTGFTPNNDGKNDCWRIPFLDPLLGATVRVYNRWGQIVYYVTEAEVDWNGNFRGLPQPAGVYIYQIHFKDGLPEMKGTFSLIR